ncbi:hypothetical protein [Spiroplasma sp. AdecLV25b]|uniref:hypothetical protein n=1 Tax=Spiroplasma sp. AdecLV25b TaxID=3027162 RepID=UPI0027DEE51C|nr:hypothetical protein [Spiroplasma sp. AdecLV25b]
MFDSSCVPVAGVATLWLTWTLFQVQLLEVKLLLLLKAFDIFGENVVPKITAVIVGKSFFYFNKPPKYHYS